MKTKQLFLILILSIFLIPKASIGQQTVTLGPGSLSYYNLTQSGSEKWSSSASLYTSTELSSYWGYITSIKWYGHGDVAYDLDSVNAYLANTTDATIATGQSESYYRTSAGTVTNALQIASYTTLALTTIDGWRSVTTASNFPYLLSSSNNLYVTFHCNASQMNRAYFAGTGTANSGGWLDSVDAADPIITVPTPNSGNRPDIQIVFGAPTITIPANASMACGGSTSITVSSSTLTTSYQWQYSATSGGTYTNVANGTPSGAVYTNTTTNILGISGINLAGTYYYKCIAYNGNAVSTTSSTYTTLTVGVCCTVPDIYTVTGGGYYCVGGTGVEVGLSGSQLGVTYQLYLGLSPVGPTVAGTAFPISFGDQLTPGTYSVRTTPAGGFCPFIMTGNVDVAVFPNLPVSVFVVLSENPVCEGIPVTFWALPTNGGINPSYQWSVNGIDPGPDNPIYTYIPNDGDVVSCIMTSNAPCATGNPAASNVNTMTVIPSLPVSISIVASANPVCEGTSVTYTATTINGGTSPSYQWQVNGINVGIDSSVYTYIPNNGDTISCILTSNASPCPTGNPATSNDIIMTVNVNMPVSVSIAASINPICAGPTVTFTASPINGGSNPAYQWKLNGANAGTNSPVFTYTPTNGDIIYCILTSNLTPCATGNPDTSNIITMTVNPLPSTPTNPVATPPSICPGASSVLSAISGGDAIVWYTGSCGGVQVTSPVSPATTTTYYARSLISATGCLSIACVPITVTVYSILTANISGGISPICYNTNPGTFTATGGGGTGTYTYLWYLNGSSTGVTTQTYNPGNLSSTSTIYCAITSDPCGTVNTSTTTITVYGDLTAGISGGISPICYNTSPGTFTATGGGGSGTYTYLWYLNGSSTGVTTQTYAPGNLTATSTIYCAINSASCGPVNTPIITIIVYGDLTANISGGLTEICNNTSPGTFTATGGGGTGSYTYLWYLNGSSTGITTQTYTPGILTSTITIYCAITSGSCGTVNTPITTITVYGDLTANISGGISPICYNTSPGTITATGGGGSGVYTYLWYLNGSSTGVTTQTFNPGNLTSTSTIYCAITSGPCGPVSTSTITIIVNDEFTANISGGISPICYNTSPGTFTATGIGGTGTYTYLWYLNGSSTGVTTQTYAPANLTATSTIYCAVTSSGSCGTVNTLTTTIIVYANLTANISGGISPICYNTSPGTLTANGGGGTGSYTYLWYLNGSSTGVTTQTFSPGNLTATTTIYCVITSSPCGTVNTPTTTIIVNGDLTANISGGSTPICYNTSPGILTATGGGGTGTYTYLWYLNGISTGVTTQTYNPGNLTSTSTIYCAISSGSCGTVNTPTTTITVFGDLTANISGGTSPICYNTSPGTFTATGSGGTGSYTYLWYQNGVSTGITTQTFNPGNLTTSPNSFYCNVTSAPCGTVSTPTTIIILEAEVPVVTCPANISVSNDLGACNAVVNYNVTYNDNCPGSILTQTLGLASGSSFPIGTTTNIFVLTDASGNVSSCSFTVTVTDSEFPIIDCPLDQTRNTNNGACTYTAVGAEFNPSFSDNCPGSSISNDYNFSNTLAGAVFPEGVTGVIWYVTDASGHTASCIFNITVTDNEIPVITCAPNQSQPSNPGTCQAFVVVAPPTTADNCGVATVINNYNGTPDASGIYFVGTNVIIWTVTDIHGNINTCIQNITVTEDEIPTIICAPDQSQSNDLGVCGAYVTVVPPITADNCGIASVINNHNGTFDASGNYPVGNTTVIWVVTDLSGNTNSCTQNITINDLEGPSINCVTQTQPSDPGVCEANVTVITPTNADNCGVASIINSFNGTADASGTYTIGITPVTWTVTDIYGNISSCIQNIEVTDDEMPIIICAADQSQPIDSGVCGANVIVNGPVSFSDNCGIAFIINDYNGTGNASDFYPVGITPVSWIVTDFSGNSSSCIQNIEVIEDVAPTIICPFSPIGVERPADPGVCEAYIDIPLPNVADNCGIASVINDFNGTSNASDDYPVGFTTVTWTVTDLNGNTSSCQDFIHIIDNQLPTVVTQDITVYLNSNGLVVINPIDVDNGSSDNCAIVNWTLSQMLFSCTDIGSNVVTLTVTDANGNQASGTATITILDNTPPVVFCNDITVQLDATGNTSITAAQIFNNGYDACGLGTMSVVPNTFTCEEVGPNTVTLTINDIYGNQSTCTSTVTVEDNVPPVALCQNITVQLDATGNVSITPAQINNGSNDACGIASLSVLPNTFTCANVGPNTVALSVTDVNGNIDVCLASVTVEDNVPPIAICQSITIQLDALGNASITAAQIDNGSNDACGIASISVIPNSFTCANVGANTVTLTVTDVNGNVSTCTSTVNVQDITPPIAICQNITIQLNALGNASITAAQIDNGSNDVCGIASMTVLPNTFTCANVGTNTVTLTVTDNNGNVSTCTSTVTVEDNVPPVALCQNINVQLDATGNVSITAGQVDNGSNDACGIASLSVLPNAFTCANVGANTVTLTVTDNNGNVSTCTSTVTVQDITPPIAICQDITIQLDALGNTSITAAQIDNGSNDACGIASLSVSPNTFSCANVGINTVTLTVTDVNDNVSTCISTVTVQDITPPIAICQSITIQLDALGNASINASQIDNGSNDACGIASLSVSPNTFSCYNVGSNTVTLTVTDVNGNVSSCTSTVTVQDVTPPIAICQSITIQLDALGNASITAAQIDNGSNDACGIASLVVSPDAFTCANVGTNTVILAVTDVNGNVSSCSATVTVQDNIAPVAICQNITAQLDILGNVTITGAQVDNGSNDACGIASLVVLPNTFTCANVGTNPVILTVTDVNGNISSCSAIVTVEDNVPPAAICQNVTVYLDQTGNTSIVTADVDNGSNDACGIASLSVYPNSFNCANIGDNIVILTVTDVNGNISTCIPTVSIFDTIPPSIFCPNNISVNSEPGDCDAEGILLGFPTFTDNCGESLIDNNAITIYPLGTTIITWSITDGSGNSNTCTQSVYVESTPLAFNDTAFTAENTPVLIAVLANDIDCGNNLDPSSLLVVSGPANGSVTIDLVNGTITYTPDYMFSGSDQFNYQVCDSTGLCSIATVFIEVFPVNNPVLGIAKALFQVVPQPDNSFDITYVITLENLGNDLIENIQVTDDLASIFNAPATYSIAGLPNTNNNLTPNTEFNGSSDMNLLESATSFLEVGDVATITFTIHVHLLGSVQTFCNSAIATGRGSMGSFVSDTSDNGYISDANGNKNPGDPGENDCTPLTLTPNDVFIPQAFSPDGDAINDYFVIAGIELYPDNEITIFNRWGNKVFNMTRYDNTWDAKPNQQLNLGSNKVPEGTYYYIFEYNKEDREPRKGFVVIKY